MAEYNADVRDVKFVVFEQLDLDRLLSSPRYEGFSRDDVEMIIDEAYRLAREVFAPANEPGDREGCRLEDGKVFVPPAYHEPFRQFVAGGWLGLNHSPELGGQGAPELVRKAVDDLFFGANITLNLGLLLTPGAAHLIESFGSDELKATYCEKMYTGRWSGTMCLTESGAGSDVGASKAKARPHGDHYLIEGEKIFITFGEHDLTDNIVHCVLARIEGAPAGSKGLSLFVVPKYRVNDDGSLGEPNDVVCSGIEHKLGINGSPTCTMVFGGNGDCHAWLLGDANQGMRAMFQMMNEARISVGMQGSALANAAYQAALRYAQERFQGPHVSRFKDPAAPRVPIIEHPDVRMMLMRQKAYSEGCRSLLLFTSYCFDRANAATDEQDRQRYDALVEILTPICKAYCSDIGFRVTEWALQCYGGYGYLKDYPAEQYLRDCKIASLYEGTNGIQAIDLIGRKMTASGGANLMAMAAMIGELIERHRDHPELRGEIAELARARDAWQACNSALAGAAGKGDMLAPLLAASTYLALCGDLLMGYFLSLQAVLAHDKLAALCEQRGVDATDRKAVGKLARTDAEARYLFGKVQSARFFCAQELPQVHAKAAAVQSGDRSAWDMAWQEE